MLDAVLLPKAFYQSMSVSRRTFFCCACAVGLFNIGYPFLFVNYKALFVNRPTQALFYNAALTAALILVTGVVDACAYCLPIADLFRFVSGRLGGYRDPNLLLKFIKVYALSALIVNPIYIFISEALFGDIDLARDASRIQIYLVTLSLIQLWSFGIMSRGVNSILRYSGALRVGVFAVVVAWAFLWAYAFSYVLSEYLLKLYR